MDSIIILKVWKGVDWMRVAKESDRLWAVVLTVMKISD